jgi:hypothetical protein
VAGQEGTGLTVANSVYPGPEEVALLREAFPVPEGAQAGAGTCAWCGGFRRRHHALCVTCWQMVDGPSRREYLSLDIFDRARWILAARRGEQLRG